MNTESPVFPTQVNLKPHARFKTYHFRKREKNLTTINVWLTFIDDSKLFLCHLHNSLIYGIFIVIAIFIRLFL